MLYMMVIIVTMHGQLSSATHDFNTMQLCLAAKKDLAVVLKDYNPIISCEPKLGEI